MTSVVGENFHTKQASDYEDYSKYSQILYGKKLIESIPLKQTDHVAALGCGTGNLAAFAAAEKVPSGKVVAFDPDSERIQVAKLKYGNVSNLSFHIGTAKDVLKNEYEFDAIYSNVVLHWIPIAQRLETFESIYSALKPGGVTFHNVGNQHKFKRVQSLIKSLSEQNLMKPMPSTVFLFSQEDLRYYAAKCGFEILILEDVFEENVFPTVDAYLTWFTATFQSLILTDIHQNSMVREMLSENEDGTVTEVTPLTRLVFRKPKESK